MWSSIVLSFKSQVLQRPFHHWIPHGSQAAVCSKCSAQGIREAAALVAVCRRFAKYSFVAEPHGDLGKVRGQSRGIDSELKANAIIGLNAERYDIRLS